MFHIPQPPEHITDHESGYYIVLEQGLPGREKTLREYLREWYSDEQITEYYGNIA